MIFYEENDTVKVGRVDDQESAYLRVHIGQKARVITCYTGDESDSPGIGESFKDPVYRVCFLDDNKVDLLFGTELEPA